MDSLTRNLRSFIVFLAVLTGAVWAWEVIDEGALDHALANSPALVAFIPVSNDQKTENLEAEWDELVDIGDLPKWVYRCRVEGDVCGAFRPSELPGVFFYTNKDDRHIYRGPRSASEINLFVQRMQRPAVSKVEPSSHDSFKGIDDAACLCIASPGQDKEFIAAFEDAALKHRAEYTFGLMDPEHDKTTTVPVVECRRHRDSKLKIYEQSPSGIEAFILEALRPAVTDLTPYNHQRLLDRQWPMIYIFGDSSSQRAKLRRELGDISSSWPDLTTVLVDPLDFPDLPAKLGLTNQQKQLICPAGAVHQLTTGKIWPIPTGKILDKKSLQQWGMDVWQGNIKPWNAKGTDGGRSKGQMGRKTVKANRQIKLPNVPGLEKLRARLERRDEL